MYYTYILKSLSHPGAIYIGHTNDLKTRLTQHNDFKSKGISKRYQPWHVETYIALTTLKDAKDFERYLKSNSGKAFLRKRLVSMDFKEALVKFNNGRVSKVSVTQ